MEVKRVTVPGRARRLVASVTRTLLTTTFLLVVYYRAPLDGPADMRLVLWLAVGLVGLGVAVTWQARAIAVSETPRLRAVETVAVGVPALLVLYASTYEVMSHDQPGSFSEVLGPTDALYYTMTLFTTVGFGDITPMTESTRIVTMTQMVVGILAVSLVAKLLIGAVEEGIGRRTAAGPPAGRPAPAEQAEQRPG